MNSKNDLYNVSKEVVQQIQILKINNLNIYKKIEELMFEIVATDEEIEFNKDEYFKSIDGYDDKTFNEYLEKMDNNDLLRPLLEEYRRLSNIILENNRQIGILELEVKNTNKKK